MGKCGWWLVKPIGTTLSQFPQFLTISNNFKAIFHTFNAFNSNF